MCCALKVSLTLPTALGVRSSCHPHFTGKEAETQRLRHLSWIIHLGSAKARIQIQNFLSLKPTLVQEQINMTGFRLFLQGPRSVSLSPSTFTFSSFVHPPAMPPTEAIIGSQQIGPNSRSACTLWGSSFSLLHCLPPGQLRISQVQAHSCPRNGLH